MEERIRSFFTEYGLILLLALAGILFLVFGVVKLNTSQSEPIIVTNDSPSNNKAEIFVDVAGAVNSPGMYELSDGSRIADAIQKAGGVRNDADTEYMAKVLNQAQKLKDGQKIFIPLKNQATAGESSSIQTSGQNTSLININTASASELDSLPGVGEVTAEKIISNRPYSTLEELRDKKAINNSTFEKIKDLVTLY
jgi:competence protein ComEA